MPMERTIERGSAGRWHDGMQHDSVRSIDSATERTIHRANAERWLDGMQYDSTRSIDSFADDTTAVSSAGRARAQAKNMKVEQLLRDGSCMIASIKEPSCRIGFADDTTVVFSAGRSPAQAKQL